MANYHVSIKGQKSGPYTLEEVKAMKISDEDLVWNANMRDWQKAMYLIELNGHINITPPKLPENRINEKKAINQSVAYSLIPFIITFIWSFAKILGSNINSSQNPIDQEYLILACILFSLIPSLIFLTICYRYKIKKEIKRLGVN
jgi:hypothetical protein